MLRFGTTVCFLVIVLWGTVFGQGSHSLYWQFGEWNLSRGSGVTWCYDIGWIGTRPFVKLDGSVADLVILFYWFNSSDGKFGLGPVMGMLHEEDGVDPYAGFEIRGKWRLEQDSTWSISMRFATRHTDCLRLHNFLQIGLSKELSPVSLSVFYQPIRKMEPLNHRMALNISHEFKYFTLIGEARVSVSNWRKSVNIDIDVPVDF